MKQLFKLLQLGLQTTDLYNLDTSEFATLTNEEWTAIKEMAIKQGVSAIVLDGINQMPLSKYNLSVEKKLEWIGETLQTELRNRQQMTVMEDLAAKWKVNGCRVMIMKGQASGTMYPKPEHRSPGDVDCYLFENYALGNDIARVAGAKVDESWYKHSVINYKGETFENHQYFVHTRDGKRGKRLEKELEDVLVSCFKIHDSGQTSCIDKLTKSTVLPPVQWTAMFLTYHACAHFISEGLRLKQILDWAMLLNVHQKDVDWEVFYEFCDRNHLKRFADAMTAIAVKYLGIKITISKIVCESPFADKIMQSALYDEDYVFGSGKGNWYNRFHLIRNMFYYRWKYEEIYQTSVWKQLWWYATGFFFKTEKINV